MKTFFRIVAVVCLLLLVVSAAGFWLLSNAAVQKRLLAAKLPAGSSIEHVHLTTGGLQVHGLSLLLADGTRIQMGALDTTFDPLAALLDQTIKLGVVQLDDFQVDLAARTVAAETSSSAAQGAGEPSHSDPSATKAPDPMEALYALGNLEWLLEVERLAINGIVNDGLGARYTLQVESSAILPGQQSTIEAQLQMFADTPLASGLQALDSTALLRFTQQASGGFTSLHLESQMVGTDAHGDNVIGVDQVFDFAVQQAAGIFTASAQLEAHLPRPESLAPQLAVLGALQVQAQLRASTDGASVTLASAHGKVSSVNAELLSLDLKQPIRLGAAQNLTGDLLQVRLTELPLEWLNSWLAPGMFIEGAPVSLACAVSATPAGGYTLRCPEPMQIGPLSVRDAEALLLQDVSLILEPHLEYRADQSLVYFLESLRLSDQYGALLQGRSEGRIAADTGRNPANVFAGIDSRTQLQIGLQELFQLPVLHPHASIVGGQLSLDVTVDGSAAFPVQLHGQLRGLRARSMPQALSDYHVGVQLKQGAKHDEWIAEADFQAGSSDRPTTRLHFSGKANPQQQPLAFTAALSGQRLSQADLAILSAALTPRDTSVSTGAAARLEGVSSPKLVTEAPAGPTPPPWALLNGQASVDIEELLLESGARIQALQAEMSVSAAQLEVTGLSAQLGPGHVSGRSEVRYAPAQSNAYHLTAGLDFARVDPSFFSSKRSGAVPLRGQFDGAFTLRGAGQSLEAAVEDSELSLRITGKDGVLTAFELDKRSELGLGLVSLLGQSLEQPRMTALSNTIPYFKDIRFDHFAFELTRGADKRVLIPELKLTGDSLLLDASGSVAAGRWRDLLEQPVNLRLSLGAKGQLMDHLQTLDLLKQNLAADGYRRLKQEVELTGSLADPNTDALRDLLNRAARSALTKSPPAGSNRSTAGKLSALLGAPDEASAGPSAEPQRQATKQERLRDDVETGLNLLNSIFGN
jgi:hypothetical protein